MVFRSEMLELLQYASEQPGRHTSGLLLLASLTINKFYIMDLAPKRSLTEQTRSPAARRFSP